MVEVTNPYTKWERRPLLFYPAIHLGFQSSLITKESDTGFSKILLTTLTKTTPQQINT